MEVVRRTSAPELLDLSPIKYEVLSTIEFLTDQIREINQARNIVWIQTMAFEPGHFSDLLVHNLINASRRGVDVRFMCDAYSDYVVANSFNHLSWLMSTKSRHYQKILLKRKSALLRDLGKQCKVNKTNPPNALISKTPFPSFLGRDHKKLSIIDGTVYIGGPNLTPLDSTRADIMIKTNNKSIVEGAKQVFLKAFLNEPITDKIINCDKENRLLIDSGKRGQSLIMDYVCDLVGAATQHLTLVSPYIPIGRLRKSLNQAVSRGLSAEVISSDEINLDFAPKISQIVHSFGQCKPRFEVTRCQDTVHAKILIVDSEIAIIGSHNFDELFVYFGTEEVALLSREKSLILALGRYIQRLKNGDLWV